VTRRAARISQHVIPREVRIMPIGLTALRSAVVVCAISCAAGTGDGDIAGLSAGGSGGDAGRSSGGPESVLPPAPASSEVTGSYSLDVACADILDVCLLSSHADKDVTFALPAGTKRSSIVYTVTPQGPSAGGSVTFASTDPLDGTVHLHGSADAFSSVHIEVTGVIVIPE
jgi:hypothetical protein